MKGEFDLIERYFAPLAGPAGLGLRDDAACVSVPPGTDLVVTKDVIVEGVHFRQQDPANLVGHKALAVNVSDCAAKGAFPKHYWLGLCIPDRIDEGWLSSFSKGLHAAQTEYGCFLAGGDTTRIDGPVVASLTLAGSVPPGAMIRRSGAVVGDDIYVTGTMGNGSLGLWCLDNGRQEHPALVSAYQKPEPPFGLIGGFSDLANCAADVSDGLIADARHLAEASGVCMRISLQDIPLSLAGKALLADEPSLWSKVWSGGDDYQIVFTAARANRPAIAAMADKTGIQITRIGGVLEGSGVQLLDKRGEVVQVTSGGYQHF